MRKAAPLVPTHCSQPIVFAEGARSACLPVNAWTPSAMTFITRPEASRVATHWSKAFGDCHAGRTFHPVDIQRSEGYHETRDGGSHLRQIACALPRVSRELAKGKLTPAVDGPAAPPLKCDGSELGLESPNVPREGHQSGERGGWGRFSGRIGRPPGQFLPDSRRRTASVQPPWKAQRGGLCKRRGRRRPWFTLVRTDGGMMNPRQPRRRSRTGSGLPLCRKPCSGRDYTPSCDVRKYPWRILWIIPSGPLEN